MDFSLIYHLIFTLYLIMSCFHESIIWTDDKLFIPFIYFQIDYPSWMYDSLVLYSFLPSVLTGKPQLLISKGLQLGFLGITTSTLPLSREILVEQFCLIYPNPWHLPITQDEHFVTNYIKCFWVQILKCPLFISKMAVHIVSDKLMMLILN